MAQTPNTYGYIPVESIDWAKGLNTLSTTISGIGERREKEKEYLDQLKANNTRAIQSSDAFASQTFGQMMLGASQNGVDQIKAWNDALKRGELSPQQYKQNMNNLMEGWGTLANNVKSFDAKNAELQKKLQDGTASKASIEAAQYFAKMGDLKNMQVFIDPSTGTVSTGRLDPKTGQVIPDTIDSAKTAADPSNTVFDRVYLDQAVREITKLWQPYVNEQGITTLTDLKQRPGYAEKLSNVIGSFTSNPRMVLSILQDNTDENYQTYYTESDKIALLNEAIELENQARRYQDKDDLSGEDLTTFLLKAEKKLIPMKKDSSGVYQPMISEEQKEKAKEVVEYTIDMQIEYKSLIENKPIRTSTGTKTVKKEDKPQYYQTAAEVREAWQSGDVNKLSNITGGKWIFIKEGKGKYSIASATDRKKVYGPFVYINDVGSYFGVNDREVWKAKMDKARAAAKNKNPQMTQDQWNAKWAKLKKGQSMVGLDGKTYTKK